MTETFFQKVYENNIKIIFLQINIPLDLQYTLSYNSLLQTNLICDFFFNIQVSKG
jgi:hypothetical protein